MQYVINVDEYKLVGIRRIALCVNGGNGSASYDTTYFDGFRVEHIPEKIKKVVGHKIITNIYRIQAYDSIICGYFCIGLIDSMLKCKSLLDYTNLFSPNEYEKNDKIILNISSH